MTLTTARLIMGLLAITSICMAGEKPPRPQPLPPGSRSAFDAQQVAPHVLADPNYYCWGLTVVHWTDGKYHGYYARWPKSLGFDAWLTHCEIAHAVADSPEGPFITQGTVIESRHLEGWDIVNAHNPSVCVAEGKIHLYYISNNLRGEFEHEEPGLFPSDDWLNSNRRSIVRNRQCIGVAHADQPAGPFVRSATPVVVPHGRFKNIAVNPAVIYHNGTFVMIVKGDDINHTGWFRIQLVGHSDRAEGPFVFQTNPIYEEVQTEDACLWFDQTDGLYHSVFHVMGNPSLAHLVSTDSFNWREAEPFTFMAKQFLLDDGTLWKPYRVERPFILTDAQGRADWIYLAVSDKGGTGNIAVSINNDSDGDGLTDEWEIIHFGSITAQVGVDDFDSDNISNQLEEYYNSDPTNAAQPGSSYVGLCAWWKLDDAIGLTAVDSSGHLANGTLDGPVWNTMGHHMGALELDGVDDFVETATTLAPANGEITITAWIKPSNLSENNAILSKENEFTFQTAGSKIRLLTFPRSNMVSGDVLTIDEWQFVAVSLTPDPLDGCKFYLNGVEVAAVASRAINQENHTLCLGKSQYGQFFNGGLDDVRLYNRVLSPSEILDLYTIQNDQRVYLSDLNWDSQTTGWGGSVKKDLSIGGRSLILDGITYPKGLGTHAQSEIVYTLAGNYVIFHSIVGLDDETGSNGSVIFKVYGDDVLLYETAAITGTGTETLTIDVAGVQTLKLVVDTNGSNASDHADWADACFLLDTDSDGLADEWETTHFGDITTQNGVGDPDNDGASNRQEQTFNTDPMDANDAPSAAYINLRGWWKLDETTGTLAADSSKNGLDASNTGGVQVGQVGHVDGAFTFDGVDGCSTTTGTDAPNSSILTITAWIHPTLLSDKHVILGKRDQFIFETSDNTLRMISFPNRSHYSDAVLVANEWQFVVVTFTPSTTGGCRFYRNGILIGTEDSIAINQNSNALSIGKSQAWNQHFEGGLDDIRLYDRVLTDSEIGALYQQDAGVYNLWKGTYFTAAERANPAISGDAADVDADQLSTLVEYALGLDPKTHSGSLAGCAIELDGSNGWKVEFNRHASHSDINLVLEWTNELNPANWQPVAQSIAGGAVQPLNGTTLVSETGSEPTVVELNVPSTVPHGFIRWKVERR